jgi:hypothetical protein
MGKLFLVKKNKEGVRLMQVSTDKNATEYAEWQLSDNDIIEIDDIKHYKIEAEEANQ